MSFLTNLFGRPKLDYLKRYDILKEAMSGTMSRVYQARDKKTGEEVALKILDMQKLNLINSKFPKNAKKPSEGEIAMQFCEFPNIVKTLEVGVTIDGEHYLVMEYLSGTGLNNVLMVTQQDLLAGARIHYARQAAEAIQTVHSKGFIHRDICPRNLIFTDDFQWLKLTDFGLSVPNRSPFTEPGNRTGTPNYMAPELVRRRKTDLRLDVFAFGVTMYEMFTKELPWLRGNTGLAAMTHDQPPTPITEHRPQINPKIAQAIHHCIEPDVNKRCSSMTKFLESIRVIENDDE